MFNMSAMCSEQSLKQRLDRVQQRLRKREFGVD